MSLLAAVIDWNSAGSSVEQVGQLLSALPARSPEGRRFCRVPHAVLGFGRRVVRRAELRDVQPFRDDRRAICAVGDLRLDNRDDLIALLADGGGPLDSDIAIVVAAYERWGDQTAEHLIGDFAFVIWDGARREAYAARDPFGVRSLVYRASPGKIIFATDVAQLLALPDADRSLNDQTVVGFLSWTCPQYGSTFFRAINSVRPGHYLRATSARVYQTEYFRPPSALTRYARTEDYEDHFRALFERAVRDRLESDHPIVAHLSGGLDSSSIVCMAERIYGEGKARAPLYTASALFPGQPYDETSFIDAVTHSVSFPSLRWDGNVPSGREFSHPSVSIPGTSVALAGGSIGDLEGARSIGARVLLAGTAGDFVTGEAGLFNELLVQRKWFTLLAQVSCGGSAAERRSRLMLLRRAVGEEAPRILLRAWRMRNRGEATSSPPRWLRQDLHGLWTDIRFRNPQRLKVGFNRLQQGVWSCLRWPWLLWAVDFLSSYAAADGIEVRCPFLDSRLVAFMVSIPYEHRLMGNLRRRLHREAMSGLLPQAISQRSSKPNFNGAVVRWGHASLRSIRDFLEGSSWYSDRFVEQREALALLNGLASRVPAVADREGWLRIRSIVNIEAWHRAVFRYPHMKETLPMIEAPTNSGPKREDGDSVTSKVPPYVAPKLAAVGNVRAFLATGVFSADDGDAAPAGDHNT